MQRRVVVAVLSACLLCVLCPVHARFYYKDFRDLSHLRLAGAARQSPRTSSASRPALTTGAKQQCVAITWTAQPDAQAQTHTQSDTNAAGAIAPMSASASAAVAAPSAPSSVQTGALWYDREISMERENTAKPKQGPDGFGHTTRTSVHKLAARLLVRGRCSSLRLCAVHACVQSRRSTFASRPPCSP